MALPKAALRATLSCGTVMSFGVGQPFSCALATLSCQKAISEPETKKRWSTPPNFIDVTNASDQSSPAYSFQRASWEIVSAIITLLYIFASLYRVPSLFSPSVQCSKFQVQGVRTKP